MSFKRFLSTTAICAVVGGAALFGATSAQAAGFYLQEQSVSGLGAAFSGSTTSINDASTAYFNPANMTKLDGPQLNLGVHFLKPHSDLDDTGSTLLAAPIAGSGDGGNPYSLSPVPNMHIAYPWMDGKLWTGFSVTAPFGLSNNYNDDFFGRYDSTSSDLEVLDFSPTVAFKAANWLSVGGGLDIQHAKATLKSAVFSPLSPTEGESRLHGSDTTVGYNIGITLTPMEGTDIGLTYRNEVNHELDGNISLSGLTGVGAAGNFFSTGKANLNLPDIAAIGIGQDVGDKWRVMANVTRFGWSNFRTIAPRRDDGFAVAETVQDYKDTWAYAIGAEYEWNQDWTFRAGYQYDETPTQDSFRTTRTPDGNRNWFAVGVTYDLNDKLSFDLGAAYIDISDESINVTRNAGIANIKADSSGSVKIFSGALNYKF